MELLRFGHSGAKALVFPTREGRFYDYENWGLVDALRPSIEHGNIQLFCVDSIDSESLYCRHCPPPARIARHKQYERYIRSEVLPLMWSARGSSFLIAHGCSIGAYHAMNISLRHPGLFGKTVALSGRFDLSRPVGPFHDLFDGHYDEDIYFHTPVHFLPGLNEPGWLDALRTMQFALAVGEFDPFMSSNRDMSRALSDKGVPHTFCVWDGMAHRASAWRRMLPHYL
jgi:esterase/lipase superfamily enzyme